MAGTRLHTGHAEAKDSFIILHKPLQQSALPCARGATQNYRPGSSHHATKGEKARGSQLHSQLLTILINMDYTPYCLIWTTYHTAGVEDDV